MNSNSVNATSDIDFLIQDAYLNYVAELCSLSALVLVVYDMMLNIPREARYMWKSPKPFTIPTLLYAITRYETIIFRAIQFRLALLPDASSFCDDLANTGDGMGLVAAVGIQGTSIIRAYALCEGNKVIVGTLIFLLVGSSIVNIYSSVITSGCVPTTFNFNDRLEAFLWNASTVLLELGVIGVCLWKVWATWKLKDDVGIRNSNDLVSIILRQIISRFCFAVFFTGTLALLILTGLGSGILFILKDLEQSLSATLLADFTLDLRQQNSTAIQSANVTLSSLQFHGFVDYIHQSIMVEMSDHENAMVMEGGGGDIELLPVESPDVEAKREESA